MPFFSRKKIPSNNPPVDGIASQSTQQPQPVCTWSAHDQSGLSPSPFPRDRHSLTAIATAAGELFLFGGDVRDRASSDLYVISTWDFSTTLLQTSGEVPTPRYGHRTALIGTTLLICGGQAKFNESVPNNDSLYLLNLGTSDPLMSSPTPADHGFAFQNRESGPALWSIIPGRAVVAPIPQRWSVPSSSSSVVGLTGRGPMICGHSI
jgi:Galactose oxidase, central domain